MGGAGYDAITEIVMQKIPSPQDFIPNNSLQSTESADFADLHRLIEIIRGVTYLLQNERLAVFILTLFCA